MKKSSSSEKLDDIGASADGELEETSFITNIKIDLPNSAPSLGGAPGGARPPARTTTLALDPRPYRKRERFYSTLITLLSIAVLILAAALIFTIAYRHSPPEAIGWQIKIGGVETNRAQLEFQAAEFMREHAGALVTIEPMPNSVALAGLARGDLHIVQTNRRLTDVERQRLSQMAGRPIREIAAPRGALAVYVHPDNPISELTLAQLRAIYAGEITNWQALGGNNLPIILYGGNYLSSGHYLFREKIMGNAPLSPTLLAFDDASRVAAGVAASSAAIGFGDAASLPANVRVVRLKISPEAVALAPIEQGKLNDNYPLSHDTFWYVGGALQGDLKAFADRLEQQK
jgi:phosphate transport system substrate-binding protein